MTKCPRGCAPVGSVHFLPPQDLRDDIHLLQEEQAWLHAVTTPGGHVVSRSFDDIGIVIRPATNPVNGRGRDAMVLVEHLMDGRTVQRWHEALRLTPAPVEGKVLHFPGLGAAMDQWLAAARHVEAEFGHRVPAYDPFSAPPHIQYPEIAYHVTPKEFIPSISVYGLLPAPHEHLEPGDIGIFVERDEAGALVYHEPGKTVFLRLRVRGIGSTEDGEDIVQEPVHPGLIEVKHGSRWVPLRGAR